MKIATFNNFSRRARYACLALFMAAWQLAVPVIAVRSVSADAPPGNNGTLKVHGKGTPANSESNDPKVCVFNFEAFGLDPNQTGNVTIETQSGTPVIVPVSVAIETDGLGNGQSEYINDTGSAVMLADGHYKSTLYGKDVNGEYTIDLKAKSKVFKVECEVVPELDTGSVKVNKKVDNDDGKGYVDGNSSEYGFKWGLDAETPERAMSSTATGVTVGKHDIRENTVSGYEFVGWYTGEGNCVDDLNGQTFPTNIQVKKNQTKLITLCNKKTITPPTPTGKVKLIKEVINDNDGQLTKNDFGLTIDGKPVSSGEKVSFDAGTKVAINEAGDEGYSFVNITGEGCPAELGGLVTVVANQTIICTITNDDKPPVKQTAKIRGFKFNDVNRNGAFDKGDGETKLSGWTMFIDENNNQTLDHGERSRETNVYGGYAFRNLVPGTYTICEVMQTGWTQTFPVANNGCHDVTVTAGEDRKGVSFGNVKDEEPAFDPCDYLQLKAATTRGDTKTRLAQLGLTGEDCFDIEIDKECSYLDVLVTHRVRSGESSWIYNAFPSYPGMPNNASFPLIFNEDYNNGSVTVDWRVLGTEYDYVALWDSFDTEVVDTDCADPVVPVTPEEPKQPQTPGRVLGATTPKPTPKPQILATSTLANTGEGYNWRNSMFGSTIVMGVLVAGLARRKEASKTKKLANLQA